ncbi:MAG: sialidase [Candidatus Cloacimonadota bacterium]|nr:MAG: sialidase [Candidatus Cloacimonadota bacterium]
MRILIILTLLIVSLAACDQTKTSQINNEPPYFTDLFDREANPDVACYRIPAVIVTPNGDLIAAVDERVPSCADLRGNRDINIIIKRSTDNGTSWSSEERIVDYPLGQSASDASFICDESTGTIFMFFNYMDVDHERNVYYLRYVKSTDNGLTWSEPVDITSQITKPGWNYNFKFITSGRGIVTENGKLLHTLVNLQNGLHIFGSDDQGESWYLLDTPLPDSDESKIIELANGDWMVNSRVNNFGYRRVHVSDNEGETWTSRVDSTLIDPGCNASIINVRSEGRDILLFCNAKDQNERRNLTVRLSYDQGRTWTEGKTVYAGEAAYSSMTVLDNGDIGIFFEKDDYRILTFARLSMGWLFAEENQ